MQQSRFAPVTFGLSAHKRELLLLLLRFTTSSHSPNAGINLTGYHPTPRLTPVPLFFFVKIPVLGTAFQCKTLAPGSKETKQNPHPGHKFAYSNAKISMKKEHNSVCFQIFYNCSFDNFLLL